MKLKTTFCIALAFTLAGCGAGEPPLTIASKENHCPEGVKVPKNLVGHWINDVHINGVRGTRTLIITSGCNYQYYETGNATFHSKIHLDEETDYRMYGIPFQKISHFLPQKFYVEKWQGQVVLQDLETGNIEYQKDDEIVDGHISYVYDSDQQRLILYFGDHFKVYKKLTSELRPNNRTE
ncbi:hypothetical protein [Grimontia sp. NTOU-MAR1]|uniref:hypothetical protein n=1 Tax=Grimontia sp. NTOU-MAR1 TaxID=3111011 RepID=UPI002DB84662|nr:hypothetical protein [Grimontia sp. NTOU-MAR1]WRV98766.1 hypothetical protein VP504_04845 [Grimontia sp. NTOU-MAR1]